MVTIIHSMQDILENKVPDVSIETKKIFLKEILQAYILDFLYNHPRYQKLNFYGGTCLHFIYDLNRLSEDIDLDNSNNVSISTLEDDLLTYFNKKVGDLNATSKTQVGEGGIHRITIKFPILYHLGLAPQINENLHLKVEISPQNQNSVIKKTPVLLYGRSLVAAHFSIETLMASKMLAFLQRSYIIKGNTGISIKGRDVYDLI